jgi:hypothetical protein
MAVLMLGCRGLALGDEAVQGPLRRPPAAASATVPSPKTLARNHPSEALKAWTQQLPPAPEGVSDLRFDEFFKRPVGPLGLELNPRLRELDGKRVRILGYMVKQSRPTPWTLMLSPMPGVSNEVEFGLAEDLPPNVVRVFLPRGPQPIPPHTPGLLLLTGRLEVGSREEADGRHSLVRLYAERDGIQGDREASPTNSAPKPSPAPISSAESIRR